MVLVVEDDRPIGEMLRDVINEEDGYLALHVQRPSDAMRAARTVRPDLLFLDVNLPEMSGLELYDRLRRDPEVADVPVVFETAVPDRHREEFRRRGITCVLSKPFELNDVLRSLHRLAPPSSAAP